MYPVVLPDGENAHIMGNADAGSAAAAGASQDAVAEAVRQASELGWCKPGEIIVVVANRLSDSGNNRETYMRIVQVEL